MSQIYRIVARVQNRCDERWQGWGAAAARIAEVLTKIPAGVSDLLIRVRGATQHRSSKWKDKMPSTHPLEISQRVGNAISRAVQQFAKDQQLECHVWYHNEPVWLVRKKDQDVYRQVQIAAFFGTVEEELFFIPHVYSVEKGTVKATERTAVEKLIEVIPLKDLDPNNEAAVESAVVKKLRAVWPKTQSIRKNDLKVVKERT